MADIELYVCILCLEMIVGGEAPDHLRSMAVTVWNEGDNEMRGRDKRDGDKETERISKEVWNVETLSLQ